MDAETQARLDDYEREKAARDALIAKPLLDWAASQNPPITIDNGELAEAVYQLDNIIYGEAAEADLSPNYAGRVEELVELARLAEALESHIQLMRRRTQSEHPYFYQLTDDGSERLAREIGSLARSARQLANALAVGTKTIGNRTQQTAPSSSKHPGGRPRNRKVRLSADFLAAFYYLVTDRQPGYSKGDSSVRGPFIDLVCAVFEALELGVDGTNPAFEAQARYRKRKAALASKPKGGKLPSFT